LLHGCELLNAGCPESRWQVSRLACGTQTTADLDEESAVKHALALDQWQIQSVALMSVFP